MTALATQRLADCARRMSHHLRYTFRAVAEDELEAFSRALLASLA